MTKICMVISSTTGVQAGRFGVAEVLVCRIGEARAAGASRVASVNGRRTPLSMFCTLIENTWPTVIASSSHGRTVRMSCDTARSSSCPTDWRTGNLELDCSLKGLCPPFSQGKLLSELSTWGIGGPAKYFCEVDDEKQLVLALRCCKNNGIRFLVIGKGSNCLFDDRGFDGCIILNRINFIQNLSPGVYRVGSGYPFCQLGIQCSKEDLTGLEFASGIPGTVGGAVFMNAGADGQETADVLVSVEIVTINGDRHILQRKELAYGYRSSPFQKMQIFAAISAATFELTSCSSARERQRAYLNRKKCTQPILQRTAGCVFRNPGSSFHSAGALIDWAGLKGMAIGGAKVSDLHANFLVNAEQCSSVDMLSLIDLVRNEVTGKFGIELQEEIIYVPPSIAL
eukprot:c26293_g1_i1 orf=249-1442(-)